MPSLPNVPTAAEAGLPKLDATSWFAVFAPAKTPKPVIDKLAAEIAKVMATPAFKQKAAEQGATADYMNPQQLDRLQQGGTGALGASGEGGKDRGRLSCAVCATEEARCEVAGLFFFGKRLDPLRDRSGPFSWSQPGAAPCVPVYTA